MPHKTRILQALSEEDKARRAAFCEKLSFTSSKTTHTDLHLVFNDEDTFHVCGSGWTARFLMTV
jgi:hypothetical protein